MATVQQQVDAWCADSPQGKRGLLHVQRVEESPARVTFRLHGCQLVATLPADEECMFELEVASGGTALSELHAVLASYAFETDGLALGAFLDKTVAVYQKLFPAGASASAPPAAAASAASSSDAACMDVDSAVKGDGGFSDDEAMADASDDDGFGEGGDGDWGDFKEANADEEIHDEAWTRAQQLKKRLIAKAETARVAAAHATEQQKQGKDGIKTIFSSEAAVTMLVNDCMAFMAASDASIRVSPVDESVFVWKVQLGNFDKDSQIEQSLQKLKSIYGYAHVELEMKFMPDLYPFFPPSVRLVRPRMQNFMIGRLVCMPELQLNQWNPTRTLRDIFESIRRVLTQHGVVDDTIPEVNDPDSLLQPYTALEFELLRLTMLTDIAPRVVKTMGDSDAIKLFAPKEKSKREIAEAAAAAAAATTAAAAPADPYYTSFGGRHGGNGGFKKGTGYGGGRDIASGWDVDAWKAAQLKKESEICEIAHSLATEMEKATVPPSLSVILEHSCLLPFLQQYLGNDSISDMESHSVINHSVLDICKNMARHTTLVRLFELLPGERRSLADYLSDLRESTAVVARFEKFNPKGAVVDSTTTAFDPVSPHPYAPHMSSLMGMGHIAKKSKNSTAPTVDVYRISLVQHIQEVAEEVEMALATYRSQQSTSMVDDASSSSSSSAAASSSSSSSSGAVSSSASSTVDYVATLKPYRFGEVEQFTSHHYYKQYASSSTALSRQWVKRLATEYADLSKSLPIHPLSSTWLRYKEDAMAFCQFLIAAPDETPYGYGMFLFDSYFPNTYPSGPPLVNLQTTGGGSVRFNPNLYNCGKVCLSLLGTWSGAAGENWNAQTSTFLQVVVSIQSLILVPEPYFNEPGYQASCGTHQGQAASDAYNRVIEVATVKFAMLDMMKKPPSWAVEIVRAHFCLHRESIMKQCTGWAANNPAVAALLPQLKAELEKQALPDGSKPLFEPPPTSSSSPAAKAASSSTTPPAAAAAASSAAADQ